MNFRVRMVAGMAAALCLAALPVETQNRPVRKGPKLVVLLVVDQMRADYITSYGHQWGRGLRRLVDNGAWFQQAAYPYLNTVTCPGHATISTGSYPASHGMILNAWWDRVKGRQVNCTDDPLSPTVSYGRHANGSASARFLSAPTLTEQMREQLGGRNVRIVSLSAKARSAIMMAGHRGEVVTWFESGAGAWASSASYTRSGASFLHRFFRAQPVDRDFGKEWSKLLPEAAYLYDDDAPGERPPVEGWSRTFPHAIKGRGEKPDAQFYNAWRNTPCVDDYLGAMARAAVDAMRLGRGRGTDVLAVGFSALDEVGHDFGPRSHEVQDVLARLDVTIGKLLTHLDRTVGAANYVVALTADHGVAVVPEQLHGAGEDAGRVPAGEIEKRVEAALEPFFGNGRHVARSLYTDLYFNNGFYQKLVANPEALEAVTQALMSVPGVARVFRSDQLSERKTSDDPIERAAALSYYPGRSGDMIIVPKPKWFFVPGSSAAGGAAATHGTVHEYDARVPVIFMGKGIKPGQYSDPASPADVAPTLAHLCGVEMHGADGHVLRAALVAPPKN